MLLLLLLAAASLEEQTMLGILERHLPGDFVLVNVSSRNVAGARWNGEAAPAGSLLKPFTALAWGEQHAYRYPEFECRGAENGCWLPRGHGRIGVVDAIANSCNAWFRQLAEQVEPRQVVALLARYGLAGLRDDVSALTLIGSGDSWRFDARALALAYAELITRGEQPGVKEIVAGMALAARVGTAQALGGEVFAKTGTAWCAEHPGDGYVLVAFPREMPRYVLLARVHGTTGANAVLRAAPAVRELLRSGKP